VTIAPEDRFLLATARSTLSPGDVETIDDLLSGNLDWEYLVEVSTRHAVAPLVHASLEHVLAADPQRAVLIPAAAREQLRDLHAASAARTTRLLAVLGDIVRALAGVGVTALGLKDVQLAVQVYPERALRPMGDVDVLIHHEDLERVQKAMAALGFSPHPRDTAPHVLRYGSGRQFRRASDEIWIDVQWDVAEREWDPDGDRPFGPRAENMWQRAVPLRIDDYDLLAPCPEDMLLHLCLHLEGHEYCELVLFSDIVEFVRHYEGTLDWHKFVAITRDANASASVHHVLRLTTLMFGVPMPPDVLAALAPPYFAAQLYGPLFSNLTSLHQTLDDIDAECAPPPDVMERFEQVARRQTYQADALHRELDAVAREFIADGGAALVFHGSPSRRVFPEASVRPFEPVHMFILETDRERCVAVLRRTGFEVPPGGATASKYRAEVALRVEVSISDTVESARGARIERHRSNRKAAVQSLTARRSRRGRDDSAQLVVHTLSPAALVFVLAADLGRRCEDVSSLFEACGCIDLPAAVTDAVEPSALTRLALVYDDVAPLRDGLAVVAALLGPDSWAGQLDATAASGAAQPHPLRWARYGPDAMSRRPELRPAFLWLLTLVSSPGMSRKARYVGSCLRADGAARRRLVDITAVTLQALRASSAPKTTRDLCYWVQVPPQ
jgi:hypothetical protein